MTIVWNDALADLKRLHLWLASEHAVAAYALQ